MNYLLEKAEKRYIAENLCYIGAVFQKSKENSLLATGCPSNYYIDRSTFSVFFPPTLSDMFMLELERLNKILYLACLKSMGLQSTVITDLLGRRLVLSVFLLAVPVEGGQRRGEMQRDAERSRREILTAWSQADRISFKEMDKDYLISTHKFSWNRELKGISLQVFLTLSKYLWIPRESVCLFSLERAWPKENNCITSPWSC